MEVEEAKKCDCNKCPLNELDFKAKDENGIKKQLTFPEILEAFSENLNGLIKNSFKNNLIIGRLMGVLEILMQEHGIDINDKGEIIRNNVIPFKNIPPSGIVKS